MLASINFSPVLEPVLEVINAILWPAIGLVGALGTIYCIILGVKLAKSDEAGSREKAKKRFDRSNYWFRCNLRFDCWSKSFNADFTRLGKHTNYSLKENEK